MTTKDLIGLVLSYAYAAGLIGIAEALLRRRMGMPQELTRKLVHIGAGMWVFGVLALFDHWQWGILPFATFIFGNYLFYRNRVFRALDEKESTPGTVYFAIAITLLFGLLWRPAGPIDRAPIAVSGVMALTWGDAMAAIVGRRYGWHGYSIARSKRSWEGSIAMLVVASVTMYLALVWLPGSALSLLAPRIDPTRALLAALLGAGAATVAEAGSSGGADNLSVPLVAAAVVYFIAG